MFELKIITQFAAAHRLLNFKGKCEQLHGHNWKVEVFVRSAVLDETGLVKDFGEIKAATHEVLNGLDHQYLNDLDPFRRENPSSEHLARHIYRELKSRIDDGRVHLTRVSVWESDTACASYFE